ncbi:PEP/pyruvate-binding domain-containing protein [Virgisporangium aurantiacum]|uniref:Phosphoenolpyruvate synthase n=1 Tax=Virgisporangium aurantiacum TaxID=175570 RepID=A0A8J4E5E9_9ACTN|nr:PEP/pyruvate-binding domain-containing protein [Virgisporangium aurantiacum]GIJ62216.1 phosphoenolpyruvate synthase [Virgisporangium aurantiacum]
MQVGLPGLHDPVDVAGVGRKFAALAGVAGAFPVPDAMVIPVDEFRTAFGARSARVEAVMRETRSTVGAFLTDAMERIEAATADLRVTGTLRHRLTGRLGEVFPDADRATFAVRSSGLAEDGPHHSMAGVYRSVLGVRGVDGVAAAVAECWRSYYGPTAVAARVRAGEFTAAPGLAVIVQRFVEARLAGVAFSGLDGDPREVLVEYVSGTADGLVAGTEAPAGVTSGSLTDGHDGALADVVRLTRALRDRFGHDVDVEWAADAGGVWILQVRPVTARRRAVRASAPEFWIRRLYHQEPPDGAPLADVADVYAAFTAKRGPANRLARRHGVATTTGWVVGFTGRALDHPGARRRFASALDAGPSDECLLDVGETIRQLVVPKRDVVDRVRAIAGPDTRSTRPQAVLVRDYIRGELAMISRLQDDGLVVEYTPDGLLALNRGTAGAKTLLVGPDGGTDGGTDGSTRADPDAAPLLPHLARIRAFTGLMHDRYGQVAVEWALSGGTPVFLDYSALSADHRVVVRSGTVISAGSASGPVLNLHDDEALSRLSIGPAVSIGTAPRMPDSAELAALLERVRAAPAAPIILARRPYAVLSLLIGAVAGFVFEQGSVLSHLAILLREAGVPAVLANGAGAAPDGTHGAIARGVFSVG